jgi:dienelactone hydrolase
MKTRWRKITVVAAAVVLTAVGGFVGWALNAYEAEPSAHATAMADSRVRIDRIGGFLTISPDGPVPETGLLFYPGLRVQPEAYLRKLSDIAYHAHVQVVIGDPPLNIAALSISQADTMRAQHSGPKKWYVGGHSLGGSMACLYASEHPRQLQGVVLLGTYCGSNIAATHLRVLTVSAGNDGVISAASSAQRRHELPASAVKIVIAGMNHGQFGNYGPQRGDQVATIDDGAARVQLSNAVAEFFGSAVPATVLARPLGPQDGAAPGLKGARGK